MTIREQIKKNEEETNAVINQINEMIEKVNQRTEEIEKELVEIGNNTYRY